MLEGARFFDYFSLIWFYRRDIFLKLTLNHSQSARKSFLNTFLKRQQNIKRDAREKENFIFNLNE